MKPPLTNERIERSAVSDTDVSSDGTLRCVHSFEPSHSFLGLNVMLSGARHHARPLELALGRLVNHSRIALAWSK